MQFLDGLQQLLLHNHKNKGLPVAKTNESNAANLNQDQINQVKEHLTSLASDFLEQCGACARRLKVKTNIKSDHAVCGIFPESPTEPPIKIPAKGDEAEDPYTRNFAARQCFTPLFKRRTTMEDTAWLPTWANLARPCESFEPDQTLASGK